ncbi:TPA: hypothetical protein ACWMJN_002904 [Morganella morganii]
MKNNTLSILNISSILYLLLLIFLGAYKTPIGNISITVIILSIACLKFTINTILKRKLSFIYPKIAYNYLIFSGLLISLLLYSIFLYFIFNIGSEFFLSHQLKQFSIATISMLGFYYISQDIIKKSSRYDILIGTFIFLLINLGFNFIQLTNNNFRLWFISITALDGHWLDFASNSLRGIGLQGLSIWDTSISYAILFFISIFLLNDKNLTLFIIFFLPLLLLTILAGRTGLIYLFSFLILSIIVYQKYKLLFFFILFLLASLFIIYFTTDSVIVHQILDFSFELFINITQGKLESGSTNDLINNHLFIPSLENKIFGDNIYIGDGDIITSKIGRSSDSSFVINYTAYGIFGIIVTLFLIFITSLIIYQYLPYKKEKISRLVISLIIIVITSALYVKVPIYVSATLLKSLVFVSICTYTMKNKLTKS